MNLAADGERPTRIGADGISRRRVLAALGGGLATAVLPRFPAFAQTPPRIAIVGGGLAGLSALDTLAARGVPATLYEARAAAGGRTRSVRGVFAPDFAFDEGAQLINTDQADMLRLVRRFGLRLVDRRGFGPFHEIQIGRDGREVREAGLARALRGIAARITADSDRLDADYEAVAREIDALSVRDYLDRHGLRPGEARDALEAGIRTEYGAEPGDASALQLVFNLPTVDGNAYEPLGTSDERYVIEGGSQRITDSLVEAHGGRIETGHRVVALAPAEGGRVTLRFASGNEPTVDRVILALPASLLGEIDHGGLLSADWQAFASEVRLGANEKLNAVYRRKPWTATPMGIDGATWDLSENAQFSEVWECTGGQQAPQGVLSWYFGGEQTASACSWGKTCSPPACMRPGSPGSACRSACRRRGDSA